MPHRSCRLGEAPPGQMRLGSRGPAGNSLDTHGWNSRGPSSLDTICRHPEFANVTRRAINGVGAGDRGIPRGHTHQVNSITDGYLAESFFPEYQGLRDQLMEILSDEDLGLRLGGATETLGGLRREIGGIE